MGFGGFGGGFWGPYLPDNPSSTWDFGLQGPLGGPLVGKSNQKARSGDFNIFKFDIFFTFI